MRGTLVRNKSKIYIESEKSAKKFEPPEPLRYPADRQKGIAPADLIVLLNTLVSSTEYRPKFYYSTIRGQRVGCRGLSEEPCKYLI